MNHSALCKKNSLDIDMDLLTKNKKFQPDVWELLRRNLSRGQLAGYALANIVGLAVVLTGLLFYCDSRHVSDSDDQFFSNDYVVVSKKIDGIGFAPTIFSDEEIKDISRQSWVKKVGRFTASRFAVNGAVEMGGKYLSTYMFFESVPDEFFDVKPEGWAFRPGSKTVPVILCKDYLTLYNFGFAIPQGLPQISEELIGDIPFTLRLTGEDMSAETFEGRVVGFSSRLNTIAVPQSFMDWANEHYASQEDSGSARLILQVDRLATAGMNDYLAAHDYEVAGDKAEAGNISSFLSIVSAVVTTNGLTICALAMFILVLSVFLLLQKSRNKLRLLMLLGYHPLDIERYYQTVVVVANVAITVIAVVVTLLSRLLWTDGLESIGLGGASVWPVLLCALCYVVGVTLFDMYIIRERLLRIWHGA